MRTKSIILAATAVGLSAAAWCDAQSSLTSSQPSIALLVLNGPTRLKVPTAVREALFLRQLSPSQARQLKVTATHTLKHEPLDPTALWVLGAASTPVAAIGSIKLAERVSRRELGVQMEQFRTLATNEDLVGGFVHLDRALTIYPEADATLLPRIAQSLDIPEIRVLLLPYSQRPWFGALIRMAAQNATNPLGVAALLTETKTPINALAPGTMPTLLGKLLNAEKGYEAGQLAIRTQAISAEGLEQFGIADRTIGAEARPLTWQLANSDAASVRQNGKSAVTFMVEPGRSAILLERVTVYRSGKYLLSTTFIGSDQRLLAVWELRCIGTDSGKLAFSQRIPINEDLPRSNIQVIVPKGCGAQRWTLRVSANDLQIPATGSIKEIDLQPIL